MAFRIHQKSKGFQSALIESPNFGRDAEIRTRDLTHPKGARYQAAPRPVKSLLVSPQKSCNANRQFAGPRREITRKQMVCITTHWGAGLTVSLKERQASRGSRAIQRQLGA